MKAKEIMTRDHLWVCSESTDARGVAQMMCDHNIGSVPVVDNDGRLKGIVTDRDICCRIVAQGRGLETAVGQIMSQALHTVDSDADLSEVEAVMQEYKIRRLPVVDEDRRPVGIISIGDLAKHCKGLLKAGHVVETLEAVSSA